MTFSNEPVEVESILAATDITGFARAAAAKGDLETFKLLAEVCSLIGDEVERAGGNVIKFIGDSSLIIFPSDAPHVAVSALRAVQARAADLMPRFGPDCHLHVRLHVGKVACGLLGTAVDKRCDVIGRAVNELFLMPNEEFLISGELQRRLAR
jgi:adenylate cyclase